MCGIVGYITKEPSCDQIDLLKRMADTIAYRGPDDCGFYSDAHAFLAHRRLSIIDLSTGHQPMTNEDDALWIVFNGEIFNHGSVRPDLVKAGHRYRTRSDTETILHAYEEFGPDCVKRLRGMFSFAIWDKNRQTLFCARDRLGIKPFYYYWDGRLFAFASEIKALLQHPAISARPNESIIPEYLAFGYLSGEQTMFEGIRKLMPGHRLTVQLRASEPPRLNIESYWDVPQPCNNPALDERALIEETRRRLEEAVRSRLMSDVPLGMFLSGGVDSSAIAAMIKQMADGPLKTFSVGYAEAGYSELDYAGQVSRALGTEHHTVVVTKEQFFATLPRAVWHEDEPVVFSSSVPLYFVSRLASQHVKVVLSGEGSDELFGGYERYHYFDINSRWGKRYAVLPEAFRSSLRRGIQTSTLLSGSIRRKLMHTWFGRENTFENLQLENFYCAFSSAELPGIMKSPTGGPFNEVLKYWASRDQGSSTLSRMLYTDQKTYLVELLMRQDQMSMSASIESRVPFLDHPLVEFAMQIPDGLRIRNGERKYILKKAVKGLLPDEIIYRKKMGFPTPLRAWFSEPAAERIFSQLMRSEGLLASLLDLKRVAELIERHRQAQEDATDRIWRLLTLQIWGEVFLTGASRPPELEGAHPQVGVT
jgi:asparagine synthase (glutamine-hydrolysing)